MFRIVAVLALLVFALAGCAGEEAPEEPGGEEQYGVMGPEIPADAPRGTALEWLPAADGLAADWRQDAELYSVASLASVDAGGTAQGWLYSYVSESAGAVASVAVIGGRPDLDPGSGIQQLPEPDVEHIRSNALPAPEDLVDSPEALEQSEDVGPHLRENPGAEAAAGLDSFSGGEPVWILSTTRDGERLEERVPAAAG